MKHTWQKTTTKLMAASRGLQDKIDAFEKKAGNTIMSAENGGQQLAGAQPDSAAEAVAPAPGSASTADGPAATNVSRRHQVLARTLIKAFKSADKTPMGITTRSRLICGCPMTPERGFLRGSCTHSRSRLQPAAGDGAATPQPSRQMIVLRGLVALAAFLAAASFLLSAMFLAQSLRSERTRLMQKLEIPPPDPKQAPVAYMPPAQEYAFACPVRR
ncbi:hypothetical protein HPB51_002767 [Rhipicephalus microplus]|uniref:Uncharacterized protein n=1 Tax=Rhipicephalus microplus TaxID=6941 RepID=A0A9J6D8H8_RHIMP|nr:hypothetical protein HPB51_002767 [Rhipicephalus microplus]